jgi:iron(III) transport system ATP-binding protein
LAALALVGVTRRFGADAAVDAVSLDVADGELLALLGPSGCGKTTLLRLIAGFETPDEGAIALGGEVMAGGGQLVPPERRRIGMVFQSYALWPHMTVAGNIAYPLRVRGLAPAEREARVARALAAVSLDGLAARRPAELSGGQRQRVALARCLVMQPRLVLLDEPLANLDVHLRAAMEDELLRFHRLTGATMVYVTHDQAEAMAMADRIAVMDRGRLQQVAAPRDLYREPATAMVAGFIGAGALAPAVVVGRGDGTADVSLLGTQATVRAAGPGTAVLLRPEDLAFDPAGPVAGTVVRATYKGAVTALEVAPAAGPDLRLRLDAAPETAPAHGQAVRLRVIGGWLVPSVAPG